MMIAAEMIILIAMMIAGTVFIVMLVIMIQEYLSDKRIEQINENFLNPQKKTTKGTD